MSNCTISISVLESQDVEIVNNFGNSVSYMGKNRIGPS